jgi:hypothetical protein
MQSHSRRLKEVAANIKIPAMYLTGKKSEQVFICQAVLLDIHPKFSLEIMNNSSQILSGYAIFPNEHFTVKESAAVFHFLKTICNCIK